MRMHAAVAAACAAALLTAGCGGDTSPAPGAGAAAPAGPIDGGTGAPPLDTPQAAVEAFFAALAAAEFGQACSVLSPGNLQAIARLGRDCQSYLAENIDAEDRKGYEGLRVDPSKIETVGDTATVPSEAVTAPNDPEGAEGSVDLIKQGGRWYVVLDQR